MTDGVACRHSVVRRGESKRKAQTVNQLVVTSPVATKRSVERSISTESTESVTDWANRIGAKGFLPNSKYRGMMGKLRDLAITLRSRHLLTAVYGYYDIISK